MATRTVNETHSWDAFDWPAERSLQQSLEHMYTNAIGCDVTFLVGQKMEKVEAHRAVLIARSAVFCKLLTVECPANRWSIHMARANKGVMMAFLRYLYTDEINLTNSHMANTILPLARQYGVKKLVERCENYFLKTVISRKSNMSSTGKPPPVRQETPAVSSLISGSEFQSKDFLESDDGDNDDDMGNDNEIVVNITSLGNVVLDNTVFTETVQRVPDNSDGLLSALHNIDYDTVNTPTYMRQPHIEEQTNEQILPLDLVQNTSPAKAAVDRGIKQAKKGNRKKPNRCKCEVCGKFVSGPGSLRKHLRIHTGEKPYVCKVCGKSFTDSSSLRKHGMIHTGETPYVCDICGKGYNQSNGLHVHMRMLHTGERPFTCATCGRGFAQSCSLHAHEQTHKGVKHPCDVCDAAFLNLSNLRSHKKKHTNPTVHKCEDCGRIFSTSKGYRSHMQQRTIDKHECEVCKQRFCQMKQLNKHLMTHAGYKPNTCDICGQGFRRKSKLKIHLALHRGERLRKDVECDICKKKLSSSTYLRVHKRTHTGEKPHLCSICGRKFNDPTDIRRHMTTHSTVKSHKCDVCGETFRLKRNLHNHQKKHNTDGVTDHTYYCDATSKK